MTSFGRPRPEQPLRSHASERAWQRHGIELTPEDYRQIRRDVMEGSAIYVGRGHSGSTAYDVVVRGRLIRILYDINKRCVITVLPASALGQTWRSG